MSRGATGAASPAAPMGMSGVRRVLQAAVGGPPGSALPLRTYALPWLLGSAVWWGLLAVVHHRVPGASAMAAGVAGALLLALFDDSVAHLMLLTRLRVVGRAMAGRRVPAAEADWRRSVAWMVTAWIALRHGPALVVAVLFAPSPGVGLALWLAGAAAACVFGALAVDRTSLRTTRGRRADGVPHLVALAAAGVLLFSPDARTWASGLSSTPGVLGLAAVAMAAVGGLAVAQWRLRRIDPSALDAGVVGRAWVGHGGAAADVLIAPSAVPPARRWRETIGTSLVLGAALYAVLATMGLGAWTHVQVMVVVGATLSPTPGTINLWVSPRWRVMPSSPTRAGLAVGLVGVVLRREGPHALCAGLVALVGLSLASPDPLAVALGTAPLLPAAGLLALALTVWRQPRRPTAGITVWLLASALPALLVVTTATLVLHGAQLQAPLRPGLSLSVTLACAAALGFSVWMSRRAWARFDWARMPSRPPLSKGLEAGT